MVNTQARVQVLLEDTQQENATRRFSAESKNDFTKFYTELGTQVEQFNANLLSELKRELPRDLPIELPIASS